MPAKKKHLTNLPLDDLMSENNRHDSGTEKTATEPNDQDIKRRLGYFQGAGEPSRKGGRRGIVGQNSKKFKTDKKQK